MEFDTNPVYVCVCAYQIPGSKIQTEAPRGFFFLMGFYWLKEEEKFICAVANFGHFLENLTAASW